MFIKLVFRQSNIVSIEVLSLLIVKTNSSFFKQGNIVYKIVLTLLIVKTNSSPCHDISFRRYGSAKYTVFEHFHNLFPE